jgi:ERCC4-type nuclease
MLLVSHLEPEDIRELIADDAITTNLVTGDLLDTKTGLIIERKSANDLLASIADGRLLDQCERLTRCATRVPPVLLIHGSILADADGKIVADGINTRWNYWSVMMELVSLQVGGIVVLFVPTRLLRDAVDYLRKWAEKPTHRRIHRKTPTNTGQDSLWIRPSDEEEIMSLLVGGLTRAKKVLNKYKSIATALKNINDWPQIPGVGQGSVGRTRKLLGLK